MTGGFAKAAERCYVSPKGVSMAIKRLENELSCKLFERSPKGIALTDHAKYLLPVAEKIIRLMDNCESYFASGLGKSPELPVVMTWGAMDQFADTPIAQFKRRYPDIYLNIRQDYDINCEAAVETHEAEFALASGPVDAARFDAQFLCDSRYGVVTRRDDPLSERETIDIRDLDGAPLIILREYQKTFAVLSAAAESSGIALNILRRVDNPILIFQRRDLERAAGVTTESLAERFAEGAGLRFTPFDDAALRWVLYLIKLRGRDLSPAAAALWELLLRHSRESASATEE
jgi:DNA-binding transcriptional LysR family regulator